MDAKRLLHLIEDDLDRITAGDEPWLDDMLADWETLTRLHAEFLAWLAREGQA